MRFRTVGLVVFAWALSSIGAGWAMDETVARQTVDREQDLLAALIDRNRFDDAIQLCQQISRGADPNSDLAAKWAVCHSRTLSARQLSQDEYNDTNVQSARQPVTSLLDAYPNHPRRLFLEAQQLAVERDAAKHAVLRAAIAPNDEDKRESAVRQLVTASSAIASLADQIADRQSELSTQRDADLVAMIADLVRLEQHLQVDAVSLALMQTALFPRGSKDAIAAATKAEQVAVDALAKLPDGSPVRNEIERLRIESILSAGQSQRADQQWIGWLGESAETLPPRTVALRVRIDLALDQTSQARSRLDDFYGSDPGTAPRSIEMDLAQLEFLLQTKQQSGIGPWLETIQQRGGAYARRRAEAWSLRYLQQDSPSGPAVDPSIVAAQAKDWLRRGEVVRAAELLSAAAAAESDATRGVARATEAAAAWIKADSPAKAAEVLSDIALAKPEGRGATAAHLQAVVLVASGDDPRGSQSVESMLRRHLERWPDDSTTDGARKWLVQLLDAQSRPIEAAVVATRLHPTKINAAELDVALQQWLRAFRATSTDEMSKLDAALRTAFAALPNHSDAVSMYRVAAAIIANRSTLQTLPNDVPAAESWIDEFIQFRISGMAAASLATAPETYREDATRRLMLDGQEDPARRANIVKLIESWETVDQPTLGQVERKLWMNQTSQAIQIATEVIDQSPDSSETIQRVAELLGSSRDPAATEHAIGLWDRLAAGTKAGSSLWHRAKLASIKLLAQVGRTEQSRQRAKYILLTHPRMDEDWKRRYQAATNQP